MSHDRLVGYPHRRHAAAVDGDRAGPDAVRVRWFGCLLWLPAIGASGVTVRMRIALALLLSIVVLPAATTELNTGGIEPLSAATFVLWLAAAAGEFVLGCVLGLGVRVLFSALTLAGELIDQQAGLALRQVLNPVADGETGPTGAALAWLGAAAILLLPPTGGHLALVDAMLQQFTAMPVGVGSVVPNPTFLIALVQQSLNLALDIAAPVLASMSLITLAAGWLGRSAPELRVDSLVAPVRITVCLVVLAAATPGIGDSLSDRLNALIDVGPQLLSGTEPEWSPSEPTAPRDRECGPEPIGNPAIPLVHWHRGASCLTAAAQIEPSHQRRAAWRRRDVAGIFPTAGN